MKLRRFNQQGLKQFVELIQRGRAEGLSSVPFEWLEAPALTEPLRPSIEAERPTRFASKLDYVMWLDDAALRSGTTVPKEDDGFWAWLTLWLFDLLCPEQGGQVRQIKDTVRYIPNLRGWGYKRHPLIGPYIVFDAYRGRTDLVRAVLSGGFDALDDFYRIAYDKDFISRPCVLELVNILYVDQTKCTLWRGVLSRGQGTVRRLLCFLERLAVNYDIESLEVGRLVAMLPREFDRWKQRAGGAAKAKAATS